MIDLRLVLSSDSNFDTNRWYSYAYTTYILSLVYTSDFPGPGKFTEKRNVFTGGSGGGGSGNTSEGCLLDESEVEVQVV